MLPLRVFLERGVRGRGLRRVLPLARLSCRRRSDGQHDGKGGNLWLAEFLIDPERRWAESASRASGGLSRGRFRRPLTDRALVYVKEPCEPEDTDVRFFLHITPERIGDLPEERRRYGFDNLDFAFFPNGRCSRGVARRGFRCRSAAVASNTDGTACERRWGGMERGVRGREVRGGGGMGRKRVDCTGVTASSRFPLSRE